MKFKLRPELEKEFEKVKQITFSTKDSEEIIEEKYKVVKNFRIAAKKQFKEDNDNFLKEKQELSQTFKDLMKPVFELESLFKTCFDNKKEEARREARKQLLPDKKKQIKDLGLEMISDDAIIEMDEKEWVNWIESRLKIKELAQQVKNEIQPTNSNLNKCEKIKSLIESYYKSDKSNHQADIIESQEELIDEIYQLVK